jgi:hypothetical protein
MTSLKRIEANRRNAAKSTGAELDRRDDELKRLLEWINGDFSVQ